MKLTPLKYRGTGEPVVSRDSPDRCCITHERPEQVMRCILKAGHRSDHLFGNYYEAGRMVTKAEVASET